MQIFKRDLRRHRRISRVFALSLLALSIHSAGLHAQEGSSAFSALPDESHARPTLQWGGPSTLAGNAAQSSSATGVTNINIPGTTQVGSAQRLGINIGGQTFYDSGQLLRNLTFRNPGFEGETFRTIMHCVAVTVNSCTDSDIYAVWPANFVQGARFEFIYGNALGQTGTVYSSTAANYYGNTGVTIYFQALSTPPKIGDFVTVEMQVPGNAQAGWWTSTNGGASLATEFQDLSPNSPGKQALRINAAGSGQSAEVDSYFDSYAGRSFVQMNGTYKLTFRAKGTGGSNEVSVSVSRVTGSGTQTYLSQNITLSPYWQDYTLSLSPSEKGSSIGTVALKFQLAQSSMLLDDVALTAPAGSQNPTAFRDEVVSTLQALHPGTIRFQDANGASLGGGIDNEIAPAFARTRSGFSEQETERDDISIGLHEFLQLCQATGANPWYIVPVGISTSEMQNLIEYLGGASNTPYGAKRAALGQTAPWTSVFSKIYLEIGNEVWNDAIFHGAAMPNPAAYGNHASTLFAAARSSTSYAPNSFSLVLGSWGAVPYWTSQEMANSANYDMVDAAPYLFNSLNDTSSVEAVYGPMFAQPESVDSVPTGYMYQQAVAASASGTNGVKPAGLAVYEVQLGTQSGNASQQNINAIVPSLGAGIAVVEHMLLMMRDLGVTTQNLFALPEYSNQFQNTAGGASETSPLYGAVVDMGGQTNLRRPIFLAEQLANTAILPNLLTTTLSGANPTWNQPLSSNDNIQLNGAHELQTFAFSDGGTNRSLVLFNLSRTNSIPITVSGPGAPSGTISVSMLTSSVPYATNEVGSYVNVVNFTEPNFDPSQPSYLPPFSMAVVTWHTSQ